MDDLISRQAAIDAVAEGLKRTFIEYKDVAEKLLNGVPSAQPELIEQSAYVRCKDCKWYEGDIMGNPWGVCCHPSWVDGNSGHEVSEKGWCYRAERREE